MKDLFVFPSELKAFAWLWGENKVKQWRLAYPFLSQSSVRLHPQKNLLFILHPRKDLISARHTSSFRFNVHSQVLMKWSQWRVSRMGQFARIIRPLWSCLHAKIVKRLSLIVYDCACVMESVRGQTTSFVSVTPRLSLFMRAFVLIRVQWGTRATINK